MFSVKLTPICAKVESPLFHCKHSLIACFQHSNHLGPFSEEWKHVSQVKPISYFLYTISLLTYFCRYLSVFVLYVCGCVKTQAQEIVPTIGFNIEKFKSSR